MGDNIKREEFLTYEQLKILIKESMEEIFFSEEEYSPFNSLQDKINKLLVQEEYDKTIILHEKIMDKFEDYMKNVAKVDLMIKEFKGLVAIVRGEAAVVQKRNEKERNTIKKLLETLAAD